MKNMRVQPKLITLNDYNPNETSDPRNSLIRVQFLGADRLSVIDDEVLEAIIKINGNEGKLEIIRMEDRGQIFSNHAKRILGDEYGKFSKQIPVNWSD